MAIGKRFLVSEDARRALDAPDGGKVRLSLDLNRTFCEVVVSVEGMGLPGGGTVSRGELETMARREKRIFLLHPGGPVALEVVGERYCKLAPTGGAPTVEIDGVQMHRTKDVDPFEDSRLKVEGTVHRGDAVLDTCGGLGYTAIWAARMGAARVVSVEACPEVRRLRGENPWSEELFRPPVELVDGDVFSHVRTCADRCFDSIVHDPPRFSLAGELYGREFYAELARALKPGGRLFHYTGAPHSRRGLRDFPEEVAKRLRAAGFETEWRPEKMGIAARRARNGMP